MTTHTERVDVLKRTFVLPTKPLSIIDAINRMSLATGNYHNAMRGSYADYNGHNVQVRWNDYRRYWIADYVWSGSNVIARGSLSECLDAAKRFYASQGRGASVNVEVTNDEDALACISNEFVASEAEDRAWRDWKFDEVASAVSLERRGHGAYTAHLIAATSPEDYRARCSEGFRSSPIARAALSRLGGDV